MDTYCRDQCILMLPDQRKTTSPVLGCSLADCRIYVRGQPLDHRILHCRASIGCREGCQYMHWLQSSSLSRYSHYHCPFPHASAALQEGNQRLRLPSIPKTRPCKYYEADNRASCGTTGQLQFKTCLRQRGLQKLDTRRKPSPQKLTYKGN